MESVAEECLGEEPLGAVYERDKDSHRLVARAFRSEPADELIALLERIAAEENWQHHDELRSHIASSTYLGLWEQDGDVGEMLIGGIQLIWPDAGTGTLPCHTVWPELSRPAGAEVAHVAVLAVIKAWRGKRATTGRRLPAAFWTLCAALWRHCLETDVTELWLEATPTMVRCYRLLGWPLVVQGELRTHWGEPCYPCCVSLREVAGSLAEKATRSVLYRDIFLGALAAPQMK